MTQLAQSFQRLLAVLGRMEIPFLVGGSVASATHGFPRQTNDIDILVDLPAARVAEFINAIGPGWYADAEVIGRAIRAGRPFNLIDMASAVKFDLFPAGEDPFFHSELSRRRTTTTAISELQALEFPVASPEDIVLAKLVWYRKGGEVSDRQWSDILSVLQVQKGRLDFTYLETWAAKLTVADLLEKACR